MKKQWLIFLIILISFLFPKQKINHYAPKRENNFTPQIIETISSTEPTKEEIFTFPVEETISHKDTEPILNNYYGQLCIPEADINVNLYFGASQEICDQINSANIFSMSVFNGLYIADHNTQEFKKLSNVKIGMTGYIKLANGHILNIKCIDIIKGYNTGVYITDVNGNTSFNADFLMYTCTDNSKNILICLWKHK